MSKLQGPLVRGELDFNAGSNSVTPFTLFDVDGNVRTLSANERYEITDVSIRTSVAATVRVFFDTNGDGTTAQAATPSTAHTPAGTGIAAGTYTFAYTFYDPFTKAETPLSATTAGVTVLLGDNITVTAPVTVPSFMVDAAGNQGYIKVYRMDGGSTGFVGQSAPGSNACILTSVTPTGSLPPSGLNGTGKVVSGGFYPINGIWSDCFETGKVGPPGLPPKLQVSAAGNVMVHLSGKIVRNIQLP